MTHDKLHISGKACDTKTCQIMKSDLIIPMPVIQYPSKMAAALN